MAPTYSNGQEMVSVFFAIKDYFSDFQTFLKVTQNHFANTKLIQLKWHPIPAPLSGTIILSHVFFNLYFYLIKVTFVVAGENVLIILKSSYTNQKIDRTGPKTK